MKAAVYARVSSVEQLDGYSLDAQIRVCRSYADAKDWQIIRVFEEKGESARTDDRTQFQEMVQAAQAGEFQIILVHKLDRFSRNLRVMLEYVQMLHDLGIRLIFVDQDIDYSSAEGKFKLSMLGAMAEWTSDNISNETKKGMRERVRSGGHVGKIPFGYVSDDKQIIPCPERAPVVRRIFELYASGESLKSIGDELAATSLHPVSWQSLRYILDNPVYIGKIRSKYGIFEGDHEPIVSVEMFNAVQARPYNRKKRMSDYYMASILRSLTCGNKFYGWAQGDDKRYRISQSEKKGPSPIDPKSYPLEHFHIQIDQIVNNLVLPAEWQAEALRQAVAPRRQNETDRSAIQSQIERLNILFVRGRISEDNYEAEYNRLRSLLEQQTVEQTVTFDELQYAAHLLENFDLLWEGANYDERRELILLLFKNLYVLSGRIVAAEPTPVLWHISNLAKRNPFANISIVPPNTPFSEVIKSIA